MHRYILHIMFITVFVLPAFGQVKPDMPGPKTRLTQEEVMAMAKAWDDLRNPRVLVMFGEGRNGVMTYEGLSAKADRVASPMQQQLMRFMPDGLVALDVARVRDSHTNAALKRALGEQLSDQALTDLAGLFDADILVDVVFLPGDKHGEIIATMRAVDTESESIIASSNLRSVDPTIDSRIGFIFGTSLAQTLGEKFITLAGEGSGSRSATYTIQLLSAADSGGLDQRTIRRLTGDIEDKIHGVRWAESEESRDSSIRHATIEVRYAGRFRELLLDLENLLLNNYELAWNLQNRTGNRAVAFVFRNVAPDWYRLTDQDADEFKSMINSRRHRLVQSGLPRLAILVGDDIPEALPSDVKPASGTFDVTVLSDELKNQFRNLGFRVVEVDQWKLQRQKLQNNADRYCNRVNLKQALSDLDGIDIALHVNLFTESDSGTPRFNARLLDMASAEFVASQRWPDVTAHRLRGYEVNPDLPNSVARFVAGRLLARWDRFAEQQFRTFDLQLRNVDDAQEVLALKALLEQSLGCVEAIHGVQIATPASTFEVLYRGSRDELLFGALDVIGSIYPGAELQVYDNTLIVNFDPHFVDAGQMDTKQPEQPIGAKASSDDVVAADQQEEPSLSADARAIDSAQDRVAEALRDARESVWVIYIKTPTEAWTGTGWTIRDRLLATNAHVLEEYKKALAQGLSVEAYAFNDADQAQRLKLGRAWIHPGYSSSGRTSDRATWFDVALVEVLEGDAGAPLPIASDDQLDAIVPPEFAGYVGFPAAGVFKNEMALPNKQTFLGHINAILSTELLPGSNVRDRVITHTLKTSGGASGSPIIGSRGTVVAIHNSGNIEEVRGSSSEKGIVKSGFNAGIMIDVLTDYMRTIESELPTS